MQDAEGHRRADPQAAAGALAFGLQRQLQISHLGQDRAHAVVERAACVGHAELARGAVQEAHAVLLFQVGDLPRHDGPGLSHLVGRSRE
ncbi:hypothetical protein D3C72_2130830 [compost metagenome]